MEDRNSRLTRTGVVVSAGKMDKTIVVNIVSRVNHKVYKKVVQKSKKFKVHDENNECGIGETSNTFPVFFLSFPAITTTLSPFLIVKLIFHFSF